MGRDEYSCNLPNSRLWIGYDETEKKASDRDVNDKGKLSEVQRFSGV